LAASIDKGKLQIEIGKADKKEIRSLPKNNKNELAIKTSKSMPKMNKKNRE
jgi:hypothetical protein